MTESDWINATDPQEMLLFLRNSGKASDRKLRLFAVACCRAIWHLMRNEPSRRAVEVAELYADGEATADQLQGAARAADPKYRLFSAAAMAAAGSPQYDLLDADAPCATYAGYAAASFTAPGQTHDFTHRTYTAATSATAHWSAKFAARRHQCPAWQESWRTALAGQYRLLSDMVAPFAAPPHIDPAWLAWNEGTIPKLAEVAYQERSLPSGHLAPDRLAALADALEDVGADATLLEHLRSPGIHVRGCFVIDLLTGREGGKPCPEPTC